MTTRQRIALSALLAVPLSVNAPTVHQAVAPAPVMGADHGALLGYISSEDPYGWAWTAAFQATTGAICIASFAAPPAAAICLASAVA
ncbi:MAG: hypothetical protein GEV06_08875 [Luteitalea sp.]|nr:hypothetical protein [Luteitalea sp.]